MIAGPEQGRGRRFSSTHPYGVVSRFLDILMTLSMFRDLQPLRMWARSSALEGRSVRGHHLLSVVDVVTNISPEGEQRRPPIDEGEVVHVEVRLQRGTRRAG